MAAVKVLSRNGSCPALAHTNRDRSCFRIGRIKSSRTTVARVAEDAKLPPAAPRSRTNPDQADRAEARACGHLCSRGEAGALAGDNAFQRCVDAGPLLQQRAQNRLAPGRQPIKSPGALLF